MNAAIIMDRTRSYVLENFLYMRPDAHVEPGDHLLEKGIIDSMGVMELVQFLQDEFGIAIADEEITEDNLRSLAAIGRFVAAKLPLDAKVA